MCLIIDACSIASVFDLSNKQHGEFKPVLNWITKGCGVIVYGGKKYKRELRDMSKYLGLLTELRKQGRVVELDDTLVDDEQKRVAAREKDNDFDDPHLIAMVVVAKCKIICTNDKRAHKFIRKKNLYPKGVCRPSIYSSSKNSNLLNKHNVVGVCKK